jgi:hypothetical protein
MSKKSAIDLSDVQNYFYIGILVVLDVVISGAVHMGQCDDDHTEYYLLLVVGFLPLMVKFMTVGLQSDNTKNVIKKRKEKYRIEIVTPHVITMIWIIYSSMVNDIGFEDWWMIRWMSRLPVGVLILGIAYANFMYDNADFWTQIKMYRVYACVLVCFSCILPVKEISMLDQSGFSLLGRVTFFTLLFIAHDIREKIGVGRDDRISDEREKTSFAFINASWIYLVHDFSIIILVIAFVHLGYIVFVVTSIFKDPEYNRIHNYGDETNV